MDWDAVGAIAEAVGAVGVIASLLYLASQVRGAARASAVESKLQVTRLMHEFIDPLIQDPALNDLFVRGRADLESLSREDYYRFSNMSRKAFWFFSAGYFQFRTRSIGEDDWHELQAIMRYWLRGPGCRAWWTKLGRESFGASFAEFVDDEIAILVRERE